MKNFCNKMFVNILNIQMSCELNIEQLIGLKLTFFEKKLFER